MVRSRPSPSSNATVGAGGGAGEAVPQLQLERVLGMSQGGCSGSSSVIDGGSSSAASTAINPKNGDIAYIAGAFIVIYGVKTSRQEKFLKNEKGRAFQCLAFSLNGQYLAAGDSSTRQPEITIWHINELEKNGRGYTQQYRLSGHRFGIQSLKFSPNMDYLISLGDANDRGLFVWDFQKQERVTSNRLGRLVNAFAFDSNQRYFVTAGYSHLKFWYFEEGTGKVKKHTMEGSKESILESFTADLNKVKSKVFVGVACKHSLAYALASDGHLYVFTEERKLSKWMNIKVVRAFGCTIDTASDTLYCACADGVIRVFNPQTLQHIITLQKPPPLGQTNIETGVKKIKVPQNQASKFSDVLAVIADEQRHRIIAVYSDKMVFLWDVKDTQKIQVIRTFLSHNGPIHDIQRLHQSCSIGLTETMEGQSLQQEDGLTRFVTCASDRTIRFWHFVDNSSIPAANRAQVQKGLFRNAYCKDMSKIIFVKNAEELQSADFEVFKAKPLDRNEEGQQIQNGSDGDIDDILMRKSQDIEQAIRCIRVSHDGRQLACGDWYGNIRVHDLKQPNLEEVKCIEAHENEVLSLDFARQSNQSSLAGSQAEDGDAGYLLVSGSRDRLIQIYDSRNDYEPVQIIEQHQSTVTSVRFMEELVVDKGKAMSSLSLLSGGADKQLLKHTLGQGGKLQDLDPFKLTAKEQFKNKIFSMDVAKNSNLILTGHDKNLTLSRSEGFEKIWQKRPDPNRKVVPDHLKVLLDDGGQIAVTSSTDKQLMLFEAESGRLLCRAQCGEITTGMCFSQNGKHLVTTSSLGVIYVWKLPDEVHKLLNQDQSAQKRGTRLAQIDEEELEDSVGRAPGAVGAGVSANSMPKGSAGQQAPLPASLLPVDGAGNPVKSELADVFAQIGQVNSVVKKLENQKKDDLALPGRADFGGLQQQDDHPEPGAGASTEPASAIDAVQSQPAPAKAGSQPSGAHRGWQASSTSGASPWNQAQNHKQANEGNAAGASDVAGIAGQELKGAAAGMPPQGGQTKLNFGRGPQSLPRWAESAVGEEAAAEARAASRDPQTASNIPGQAQQHMPSPAATNAEEDMQQIFEQNLRRHSVAPGILDPANQNAEEAKASGVSSGTGRCRIDLLDGGDDEDCGDLSMLNNDEQLDDEERQIKQSLTRHRFESVYGIEGDEGQVSADLRKSRDWFSKKSNSKVRSSIAGKFFQKRETEILSMHSKTPEAAKSKAAEGYGPSGIFNSDYVPTANVLAVSELVNKQGSPEKSEAELRARDNPLKNSQTANQKAEASANEKTVHLDDINFDMVLDRNAGAAKETVKPANELIESGYSENPAQVPAQAKPDFIKGSFGPSTIAQQQITAPAAETQAKAAKVEAAAPKQDSSNDQKQDEVPKPKDTNVKVDNFVDEEQKQSKEKERRKKNLRFTNQKPPVDESQAEISVDLGRAPRPQSVVSTGQPAAAGTATGSFYDSHGSSLQGLVPAGPIPAHQVNFQLQMEIQRLNDSLKNITQLLGASAVSQSVNSDMLNPTASVSSVQTNQIINGSGKASANAKPAQQMPIDGTVSEKLSQSIGLWTTVMNQMQSTTSVDFEQLNKRGMMYSQQFQAGQLQPGAQLPPPDAPSQAAGSAASGSFSNPYYYQTGTSHLNFYPDQSSMLDSSQFQRATPPDGAKDLLEKYSEQLLEKLMQKMDERNMNQRKK